MSDDIHFYEPANGHGLPHDPFNAIVGPRPIGWISSHDSEGRLNLAPYSFFNAFNYIPPIIGFCSVGRKDSLNNIEQTGEFVWNLATRPLAEAMNQSCAMVGPEVDEFELTGLSTVASRVVSVPRVAETPVSTFSVDVDTGSYANVRRFLNQGSLPPEGAVRLEEMLNYFPYHYALPTDGSPFGVTTELAATPWNPRTQLLRIGIKASDRAVAELAPANLVFLVDVSGSMDRREGLPLVQSTLKLLVD